jgi:hypothetical protein
MINFRFHIVSLTAVLLALGIGLVLGTTFLDDATINGLKSQLDGLEHDLDNAEARNDAQQTQLGAFEDEASQLDEQLGERLYNGQLDADPVLVISTQGVDQAWIDGVVRSLAQADADVLGVWWLTERLTLDEESELSDLSTALELSTDDADRLAGALAGELADVLFGAVDVPEEAGLADPAQPAPAEPAPLARLREAGLVQYQLPEGVDGDVVRLPASGLRIVVVDGPDATVPVEDILVPMLADLAADAPMPVVATQPTVRTGDDVDDAREPRLVSAIRDDDTLRERISTVDNLESVSGRAATVLATVDAVPGVPTIGRYGTGDGADRRLPPVAGDG